MFPPLLPEAKHFSTPAHVQHLTRPGSFWAISVSQPVLPFPVREALEVLAPGGSPRRQGGPEPCSLDLTLEGPGLGVGLALREKRALEHSRHQAAFEPVPWGHPSSDFHFVDWRLCP